MRLLLRSLVVLVVVVGLVLAATELVGRPLAERAIARKVREDHGLTRTPEVSLSGFPFAVQVARGELDGASVVLEDYDVAGLRLERAELDLTDVTFDPARLIDGRSRVDAANASFAATVTETAVTAYLAGEGIGLTVGFQPGGLQVSGVVPVQGQSLDVTAGGDLAVDGSSLSFRPTTFSADGAAPPEAVLETAADTLGFTVPLPAVAGVQVSGVQLGAAEATLTADVTGYVLTNGRS